MNISHPWLSTSLSSDFYQLIHKFQMPIEYRSSPPDDSEKEQKISPLRGTLVRRQHERPDKPIESARAAITIDQRLINRDSRGEYAITRIDTDNDRITLVELAGKSTVTLSLSRLEKIIDEAGGPWHLKRE